MLPVEILPVQETIVLRARGSELLILPHHVKRLKAYAKSRDFSEYFRAEALVNRPARKLFEAWLRKDHTLWARLYKTVHTDMDITADDGAAAAEAAVAAPVEQEPKAPVKQAEPKAAKPAPVEAEPKKPAKAAAAAADKPAEKKPAKASSAKAEKKDPKDAAPAAKPAAKKATKADDGKPAAAAKKTAEKSTSTAKKPAAKKADAAAKPTKAAAAKPAKKK